MPTATINPNVINLNNLVPPIIPHTQKSEPVGRMATAEELEVFRQGREEIARGEYYTKRPDETVEEFFLRIEADPEGTMACNQPGWKL